MLWASSPMVGLDNFGGFSNLNDCVTCWGSQAGASARSGLAHPSPHPPAVPQGCRDALQAHRYIPLARGCRVSHPLPLGVTLSKSQSGKHGSPGVLALTKHIFPPFHPTTPLLLPAGSQQTGWGEYLGSVLPACGEDGVGNAFSTIQPSIQKRFNCV